MKSFMIRNPKIKEASQVFSGFIGVFSFMSHFFHVIKTWRHSAETPPSDFLSAELHSVHTCRSADTPVGVLVITAAGKRLNDLSDTIGHSAGACSDDSP